MRDAGNGRQAVCKTEKKLEKKKTIAVIRLRSDELEKSWQGQGGFRPDPEFV